MTSDPTQATTAPAVPQPFGPELTQPQHDAPDQSQFDLLEVLEDELLMALPLVPLHETCPVAPRLSAGEEDLGGMAAEKPNPFAVLAQLKPKK